jgi:TonB family protein
MRPSKLAYATLFSVLFHAGVLVSSAPLNWFDPPKIAPQEKPILPEPVEIIHFYSGKEPAPLPEMGPTPPDAKGAIVQKTSSMPYITYERTYASYIRDLIVSQLQYPADQPRDQEFEVELLFVLEKNGKLKKLSAFSRSNKKEGALFEEAALSAVRRAAPLFPPFPKNVSKEEQRFSFLLAFDRNRK